VKSPILEVHLTYRCDLACLYCNRGCALRTDHTPDMDLGQFRSWIQSAPEFDKVAFLGGEPTLHPDLVEFTRAARARWPKAFLQLVSNGYSVRARGLIVDLEKEGVPNLSGTTKPDGSVEHHNKTIFQSPADLGIERDRACDWAAGPKCGYSLDACGLSPCAIGGAIDGILGLGLRTWDWEHVNDPALLKALCRHCGSYYMHQVPDGLRCYHRGQLLTPTWHAAATTKAEVSLRELNNAVTNECACGGGGPDDPHTCPACMVYHRLVTLRHNTQSERIP
jgi:hypothetical protein